VLRRFFALLFLTALILCGLYYWRHGIGAAGTGGLGAVGQHLQDAKTTASVRAALTLNRSLKPYAIQVSTEDGVVTLRGDVPREELRSSAQRIAAAVPGVAQVVDHLKVRGEVPSEEDHPGRSLGERLDDEALEVQVRLALSLNKALEGTSLSVRSLRREVTVSGEVATAEQRRLALEIVGGTAGVGSVQDAVRVRDGAPGNGTSAQIKEDREAAVARALRSDRNLARYALKVGTRDGRLVLTGVVRTSVEKDLAGALAREAAGGPVENAVRVQP
jgi:hyperosmotically inducible protein